jgi:hypothetical protein
LKSGAEENNYFVPVSSSAIDFTDTSLFLLLQSCLETMDPSISSLDAASPLDHNIVSVLDGVNTRLSSMQAEMADGFRMMADGFKMLKSRMEKLEEICVAREVGVTTMMQQGKSLADQPVRVAATMTSNLGRGAEVAADGGQLSVFENSNSKSQQQAAAVAASMSENKLFKKAKRFQMAPQHLSLETIYFEWHGLESCKDKPIVGGFQRCEELFKSSWRKGLSAGENKQFSRLKRIMGGIQKKATMDGIDLVTVVENLTPIYQKDCKKSISLMETWMVSNGMIQKGESRQSRRSPPKSASS